MERQPGQCPFTKQACIKERCELWGGIERVMPGQVVGSAKRAHLSGCVFNLMLHVMSAPMPMPMPFPPHAKLVR